MVLSALGVWTYVFDHARHDGQVVYGIPHLGILDPDITGEGASWPLNPPSRQVDQSRVAQSCLVIRYDFSRW
jgi:hypothetical protein